MESIKFNDKGHRVEFSKRTLTIDNKEYSYTGISQIKHIAAYNAYLFRYKGEWVKLFYEEPHGEVIAALFKRINTMNARRAAQARATQSIDTSAIAAALAAADGQPAEQEAPAKAEEPVVETPAVTVEPETPAVTVEPKVEEPATAEPETPAVTVEPEVKEPATVEPETPAVTVEPEVKEPAEEEPAAKAEDNSEAVLAEVQEAAVKKAKFKKAITIFAIIIAIFVIAGIIYFFTMGPTNDASQSPETDETHQYNDIDELIEEMQE